MPGPKPGRHLSELSVDTFFEGIEQVGGRMDFAVVFDFLVTLNRHFLTVLEGELVVGVLKILVLNQNTLEGFRIETEGGTALQALFCGVQINILEVFVWIVSRYVRCLGDRRVYPLLSGRLDINVLLRSNVVCG